MHTFRRDIQKTAKVGADLLKLSRHQGYPYFVGTSMIYTGWALALSGEAKRGVELCQEGLIQLREIGAKCWTSRYLALLAECYEQAGDVAGERRALGQALGCLKDNDECVWAAEIYRLQGASLFRADDTRGAEAWFLKAVVTAQQQQARLLELRAATNLSELRMQDGRLEEAQAVLAPVFADFTEGFEHKNLRDAKLLLEMLITA
jgi:predicted ATPase